MSRPSRLVLEAREAKYLVPFRPFRLRLKDGTTLRVRHPDQLGAGDRTIIFVDSRRGIEFYDSRLLLAVEPILRRKPRRRRTG